jgi:predicted O-linked N-acetylglucosamine transferase (SPINDLY family)
MNDKDRARDLFIKALKCLEKRDFSYAEQIFVETLNLAPRSVPTLNNLAIAQYEQGKTDHAALTAQKVLEIDQNNIDAYLTLSTCQKDQQHYDEALKTCQKIISIDPTIVEAHCNLGSCLSKTQKHNEAIASFDRALALRPDSVEAWLGRGNVFTELKRYNDAFAAYDKALALNGDLAGAWLGRGNVFTELKRYNDAFVAYNKALALKPDLAETWLGRGNVLTELKRYNDAFAAYDKALALKPDLAEAWLGRGTVFIELKQYKEALAAYDKALALKPDLTEFQGGRLHCKMHLCDWSNFTTECQHLISAIRNNKSNTNPFAFIAISTSREDQLKCAKLWINEKYPTVSKPIWNGEIYKHDKIRIGYVSADFQQHATSDLIAGLFEGHDKAKFKTVAISIGPDDNSKIRVRLTKAFDSFSDVRLLSDEEIASQIKHNEIDILVDLKGFTQDARTGIFAHRPAPIQVNYLGYPGTMGGNYIDYIIADQTLIPLLHQQDYSEKIVYLPNSYQVNDRKRAISEKAFSREELGLPHNGFVFCCFNNSYKISPEVFDCWMRIIKNVKGSVLWLLEVSEPTTCNLRMEAKARGIDPDRLVFAKKLPAPDHLARHRLADLSLDTLPYNAHTTASDALWAGLPVLTQIGETFAGRVAASLLNAIGLGELIATTARQYEEIAIELAINPEKLAAIKTKLANNRLSTPLFDTQLFTRHIENAYEAMYERHRTRMPPDHIYVSRQIPD